MDRKDREFGHKIDNDGERVKNPGDRNQPAASAARAGRDSSSESSSRDRSDFRGEGRSGMDKPRSRKTTELDDEPEI